MTSSDVNDTRVNDKIANILHLTTE